MDSSLVTVAIVPRERFSFAERSLASVLQHTPPQVPIVYVDGNSPQAVQRSIHALLDQRRNQRNSTLVRSEHFLSPNVARNLAAAQTQSKYILFVDNDVLVSPLWIESLVQCAESTGAWAVGPLYCQGEPIGEHIHMAGGTAHFYVEHGKRRFRESHTHCGMAVPAVLPKLRCGPVELLEFHTMLLRTDTFARFGKLDEEYLSLHEHVDLCITLRGAGLGVYMEPRSVTTYVGPLPLANIDRDYFSLRWCDAWNRLSMHHFQAKWDVDPSDPGIEQVLHWGTHHRCKAQASWQAILRPLGSRRARRLIAACESVVSRTRYRDHECLPGRIHSGGRTIAHLRRKTTLAA